MAVKITTLGENTADRGDFLGEWGLSILVETEEAVVLLDTGKTFSVTHNAGTLGIDLSKIDKIVLSHGHYDHTGGLRELLPRIGKQVDIIAHPDIWQAKYLCLQGKAKKYISIPFQQDELESLGGVFQFSTQPVTITPDLMTTGEIPMVTDFEEIDPAFSVKEGSTWMPDKIMDDLALILKTEQGLVVISGCAHHGIINTLYHALEITGVSEIHTLIGGSHLIGASGKRLQKTITALKDMGLQRLGLCHCTDLPATSVLAQEFGDKFFFNKAGTTIHLN